MLDPALSLSVYSQTTMPALRRFDSNTTHVSDSEPEREAARSRLTIRTPDRTTATSSTGRRPHRTRHTPFSDRSNESHCRPATSEPNFGVEVRLADVEREIRLLKEQLHTALQVPPNPLSPSPCCHHERSMADKCVGEDVPIGGLDSPLVVLGYLDRIVEEAVGKKLDGLGRAFDELDEVVERSNKHLESTRFQ
ncbi:hypothetical protein C8R43DRAFT_1030424 [Mycena crocata]|nr:hypothetical protein C8R43DRAFT_1030424 [Mycena crocata]